MHWTVLSDYEVFRTDDTEPSWVEAHSEEVTVGAATIIISRQPNGTATVQRVISPVSKDYLRPEWQPGQPYNG